MKYAWVAHSIARKLVTLNAVFVTFVFLDFGIIYAQNSATLGNINDKCTKATTHCIYISPHLNHTCLGNRLPYKLTSPHPIMPEISRYNLDDWTAMRAVPACWDKLQLFICSIYLPECIIASDHPSMPNDPAALTIGANGSTILASTNHRVILPELEMCEAVHKACPVLVASSGDKIDPKNPFYLLDPLPRFLDCSVYARGCRQNQLTPRLFQTAGSSCKPPFVTTAVHQNWVPGFDRCAFPCQRLYFDEDHYTLARVITGASASVCLLLNIFTMITLHLQQQERTRCIIGLSQLLESTNSDSLPIASGGSAVRRSFHSNHHSKPVHSAQVWCFHTPLFYIHLFFMVGCLGWLMPLLPAIGDQVACREDGSLRTGEPQISSSKFILCVVNFVAIYFSLMSAVVWANVFDYLLFTRTRQLVVHLDLSCSPTRSDCEVNQKPLVTTKSCSSYPSNCIKTDADVSLPLMSDFTLDYVNTGHRNGNPRLMSNDILDSSEACPEAGLFAAREPRLVSRNSVEKLATEPVSYASSCPINRVGASRPLVLRVLQLTLPTLLLGLPNTRHCNSSRCFAKTVSLDVPPPTADCPQCVKPGRKLQRISQPASAAPHSACFHALAFAIPLLLILISLTAAEIDGESLAGICFVGRVNWWSRIGLVLIPCTTSLLVKVVYICRTMRLFNTLKSRFNGSPYPVDQDFAHRLSRCIPYLGTFLVATIAILVFSFCTQIYTYVGEPLWSESQRMFVLCQLSHHLLGLSELPARTACVHPVSTSHQSFRHTAAFNDSLSSSVNEVAFVQGHLTRSARSEAKPLAGPLLLHLSAYFALNCLFASLCVFDRSVKRCWQRVWVKLCSKPNSREEDICVFVDACNDPHGLDAWLISYLTISTTGFSWWDPGIFRLPLTDELLQSTASRRPRYSEEGNSKLSRPVELSEALSQRSAVPLDSPQLSASLAHGEMTHPYVTSVSVNPDILLPPSVPCTEDIIAQLTRLISLYECSPDDGSTSLPFRHLLQQLLVSHPTASCASASIGHTTEPHLSSHTTATRPQSVQSEQLHRSADPSLNVGQHPPDLVASMAAVYEHCQKQLTALSGNSARRRSHHRRFLPGRLSGRRHRGHSRSLSTNGVFGGSLLGDGLISGLGSIASGSTSEKRDNLTDESLSLLKAAASVVAAASRCGGNDGTQLRLNQCGLPLFSIPPFELSSGAGSACEGSQVSSSSIRSAAAGLAVPVTSSAHSLISRPSSAADSMARHGGVPTDGKQSSGNCDHFACLEALGSRMSLRSLSCASSYGAESYNSYRLLINQSGASWRELWRTRMLLMDVLKWAEAVAPLMQANRRSRSSLNEMVTGRSDPSPFTSQENPTHSIPDIFGKYDIIRNSQIPQTATSSSVTSQFPPNQHSLASQPRSFVETEPTVQTMSPNLSQLSISSILGHLNATVGMDSLMAAAFAAATVAATIAWEQHQQRRHGGSGVSSQDVPVNSPASHETNETSALFAHPQQCSFGVSSSVGSPPFPAATNPPCISPIVHPVAMMTDPPAAPHSSPSCAHPNVPTIAWPTPTTRPFVFQPTFATESNSVHLSCPLPQSYLPYHGYPYGVMVSPYPAYRDSPDLLANHNRTGMTFVTPSYTPPFSVAAPPISNIHHSISPSPQFKPQSVPLHPLFSIGQEGIVMHDIRNEHRQLTNREHPMGHSDGSPSNIKPCQNVGGSLEDPNDSDAFDSEDEVMSDSETPAIAQQPQKCESTSLHTPLVPLVYPIEPSKQAYFLPFYPHIPQGSTYPFYPPAQYPDCVAPPSALGGADDGEVSSVSQSASQVIPRGSSPPNDDNQGDCCPSTTTTTYPPLVDPTQSQLQYYSTDPTKQML